MPPAEQIESPRRPALARFLSLPTPVRWSAYVGALLVLVLIAATAVAVTLVRRPFPQTSGSIDVAALEGPVEVIRDENGIPQLYADTLDDLLTGQGYVQAQERFFEMDFRRHLTAGRLAELFGETAVETDAYIRTMGWRDVAERELALVEPRTRAALQAYADGVNAYLEDRSPSSISLEYTMLGLTGLDYTPAKWTSVDSLAWLKAMAWDLSGNMDSEIGRVLSRPGHTSEQVDQLYPGYPYDEHTPIVDRGKVIDGVFEQNAEHDATRNPRRPAYDPGQRRRLRDVGRGLDRLPAMLGDGDGIGSNSWVIGGEHTSTGQPLLANDPHLGVSMPGIWMQMGLHCRRITSACPLDSTGFTFSGVPGVIIGHNRDIAWGFTNLGPDVADLYVEQVDGDRWRHDGRWKRMQTRNETIEVFGGDDVELKVRETKHGPILSDVDDVLEQVGDEARVGGVLPDDGAAVSLAWTALRPGRTADAILKMNLAGDWTEFREAARSFEVPAQNLVYADREGHIGYQAPGAIPIRKSGNDGSYPNAGWRAENDWSGDDIPFDGLPSVLDPEEGFIVTANQAAIGDDYPWYLTDEFDQGYRSQRIRDLIEDAADDPDGLSIADMSRIQLDDHHPLAPILVPRLLDQPDLGSRYFEDGRRLLRDWDFRQQADSAAAAYFNVVWSNLLRLTFQDELPKEAWPDGGDRWFSVVADLLDRPDDPFWDDQDTAETESRDDILQQALKDGRDDMTRLVSLDPGGWEWGKLHRLNLHNATLGESGNKIAELAFNRDRYRASGGSSTVNATGWNAAEGYEVVSAPSMRMVVSLADFDDSRWINLTGVSGHTGSSHYADQTELWLDGETLPWRFSDEAVRRDGEDVLELRPTGSE